MTSNSVITVIWGDTFPIFKWSWASWMYARSSVHCKANWCFTAEVVVKDTNTFSGGNGRSGNWNVWFLVQQNFFIWSTIFLILYLPKSTHFPLTHLLSEEKVCLYIKLKIMRWKYSQRESVLFLSHKQVPHSDYWRWGVAFTCTSSLKKQSMTGVWTTFHCYLSRWGKVLVSGDFCL